MGIDDKTRLEIKADLERISAELKDNAQVLFDSDSAVDSGLASGLIVGVIEIEAVLNDIKTQEEREENT